MHLFYGHFAARMLHLLLLSPSNSVSVRGKAET